MRRVFEQIDAALARADKRALFALTRLQHKIPIRFDLLGIDRLGIVSVLAAVNIALKYEDIFPVRVGVMMLAFPPFRLVSDFRKDQRRANRFENIRLEINLNRRDDAIDKKIDEILSSATLGHHPRT